MTLAFTSIGAQIALVVAMTFFIGVVLWIWLTPKRRWDKDARIPIDDEPQNYDDADSAGGVPPSNQGDRRP
ncbi:MAG: cbb3-type cytochrome c oxidase subunit 3 [Phycisphaeraceae bacterium]|nr:cbb3-type cytochrome c oxidase subunit 3 [Phycisphaeraceae bacterium]